jgi:hypothetical protein
MSGRILALAYSRESGSATSKSAGQTLKKENGGRICQTRAAHASMWSIVCFDPSTVSASFEALNLSCAENPKPGPFQFLDQPVFEAEDFGNELTPELRAQEAHLRAQAQKQRKP